MLKKDYLILQHPGHNWIYYSESRKAAMAELKVACTRLTAETKDVSLVQIAGIPYFKIETHTELSDEDVKVISNLSFCFVIFILEEKSNEKILKPVSLINNEFVPEKITSILKYPGKTNELFTKMMINIARWSVDFDLDTNYRLLDPVCGKGTTLFQSMVYGFESYGVEIDAKSVHELVVFFKKYIQGEKLKHNYIKRQISGKNKTEAAWINEFNLVKNDYASKLGVIAGNTLKTNEFFKESYFHFIVADLPYGIFHGNVKSKAGGNKKGNPIDLLTNAIPVWHSVLKTGGVMVLAWNTNMLTKHRLESLLVYWGLDVLSGSPYDEFKHKVDRAISRDIIVVKKK